VILHEPMTFATDMVLGALSGVLALELFRRAARTGAMPVRLWGAAFVASALAAVLGGLQHGVGPEIGAWRADTLWTTVLLLGGGTGFFLVASAAATLRSATATRALLIAAGVKLLAYVAWVPWHPEFRWLIYDYGSAMVIVATIQLVRLSQPGGAPSARFILAGIATSVAAAIVQQAHVVLHASFNHNDLYHVIQMAATTLLYAGGRRLAEPGDRTLDQR
jgi:hypothetical protein